jgi:hypothetical protein
MSEEGFRLGPSAASAASRLLPALSVLAALGVLLPWGLVPADDTLLYLVFSCALAGAGALILGRHPGQGDS